MKASNWRVLVLAFLVAFSITMTTAQQPPGSPSQGFGAPGPFTTDQATAGRAAYQANCAACHGADLNGVPPLAGAAFMGSWGTRTTRDLLGLIQTTMPTDRPGTLPAETYVNIVAYILQANGIAAGSQALTTTTTVAIGGGGAGTTTAAPTQAPAPPAAQGGRAGGPGRTGPAPWEARSRTP